jgi:alkyl hydroperoxide reductase subunit AhpF
MKNKKKKRKRKIEVFVSMCQICFDAIDLVNDLAGPDDEVTVLDVERSVVADRARELDILSVPCVVIDGAVAGCCQKGFPYEWDTLKNAGLGQPLPKT